MAPASDIWGSAKRLKLWRESKSRFGHKRLRGEMVKAGSDHSPRLGAGVREAWDGSSRSTAGRKKLE